MVFLNLEFHVKKLDLLDWIFKAKVKARVIEFKNRSNECGLAHRKIPKEI